MKDYLLDPKTNKVYSRETLAGTSAVDPNHFDTDMQNVDYQISQKEQEIEGLKSRKDQILQEKNDFFAQFPQFLPTPAEPVDLGVADDTTTD